MSAGPALPAGYYDRPVLEVARDLVGCVVSHAGTSGVIVETEAYHESEPACHAFVGLTPRTVTLFGPPGLAYVYRSYGIHALLNAVCEPPGVGAAVLIRALEPLEGIELMAERRGLAGLGGLPGPGRPSGLGGRHGPGHPPGLGGRRGPGRLRDLCSGPGKLTQALGIDLSENGCDLSLGPVVIHDRPAGWEKPELIVSRRIGITKATELPWRFCAAGNPHLSAPVRRGSSETVKN